ncbi:hypothetical protein BMA10247_3209 [Burkholderia mallei NCTC 10247]|nr:hypothetical protein BMASAVP1_A0240 [Burkholderia mallei SAVP1]ABN83852.1 hypothetical protein BURPS668_0423 [Burkholderia pseudomallei 668]ABO04753.1 hypothetical protein BMA10247_3209 [Burkholderia mallei NCTC 10247]ACQ99137.1 conserved hypothetical protein [Burkholderia pseudomallei MSHR346]EEC37186.1 conserved hypothetical protein [Burkholderia pseudomallei 576]EES24628.1 hypothetical protein BURPS1106B_A3726 [Burkholderia pseudomallei 1106b]
MGQAALGAPGVRKPRRACLKGAGAPPASLQGPARACRRGRPRASGPM